MHPIQEGEGLVALLRQIQHHHQPAVPFILELGLGHSQLRKQRIEHLLITAAQLNIVGLKLILQENKHIKQRNLIFLQPAENAADLIVLRGIGGVEQLDHLIVHPRQL